MPEPDRLTKLLQMLDRQPGDTFLLYGVALEHKRLGDETRAIEFLDRALSADPNYSYAYYQKGQVLESLDQTEAAKQAYRAGIEASTRAGDAHARGELEGALQMIE